MKIQSLLPLAVTATLITSASASTTMDWVNVGNPGNAADPLTGQGAVGYAYQIGKYEVTNAQYGAFLNAKGQSNANEIYNTSMSSYGITQSGSSGSYTYSVTGALANRPVVYVSWFDAARFANWMMNGQGSNDMETGSYTLNGATSGIITANIGAQVYIPTDNEWYKAAYYNHTKTSYSLYPTGRNTIQPFHANYDKGTFTAIGSYADYPSFYGTFDQGGNVTEWTFLNGTGARGGATLHLGSAYALQSYVRSSYEPTFEAPGIGFRVASAEGFASVPEPTSFLLTMLTGSMMLIRRKR